MSSVYPEKVASYFQSMNSLSAKIFADIQAVEDTVKIDNNLSYNEKSKIIDKHLIHDVIHRNKKKQQQLKGSGRGVVHNNEDDEDIPANQIFYDDPELDKDQVTALLLSVYPKKPEKYVYEDNSFYLDEHSEPFSYCTQSQASFCQLEQLVKSLPLPSISIQSSFQSKKSDSKSRLGSHHVKKPAPLPNAPPPPMRVLDGAHKKSKDQTIVPPSQHKKTMVSALGVPVMGMGVMSSSSSKNEKKCKVSQEVDLEDENSRANNNKDLKDQDSNLPQQVQNSDLIAELQAKLKMNIGKTTAPHATSNIGSKKILHKPKAPPPPPPHTVKVGDSLPTTSNVKSETPAGSDSATKADSSFKRKPETQSSSQRTGVHSQRLKSEPEVETVDNTKADLNSKAPDDEFCVDVSSPCRIATPKTGCAFLDNW